LIKKAAAVRPAATDMKEHRIVKREQQPTLPFSWVAVQDSGKHDCRNGTYISNWINIEIISVLVPTWAELLPIASKFLTRGYILLQSTMGCIRQGVMTSRDYHMHVLASDSFIGKSTSRKRELTPKKTCLLQRRKTERGQLPLVSTHRSRNIPGYALTLSAEVPKSIHLQALKRIMLINTVHAI
jgi:hypothetical protein